MNLRCIKLLILLVPLSNSIPSQCQYGSYTKEYKFLQHLAGNDLYRERLFVLDHLTPSFNIGRINIEKAWTYSALNLYDSAFRFYSLASVDSVVFYKFYKNYLSLLFKTGKWNEMQECLQQIPATNSEERKLEESLAMIQRKIPMKTMGNHHLPENVKGAYQRYYRASKKSAALGALYSMVVPGLGKLYAGKKRQAWNMFFANAVFGVQAYEAWAKRGPESPRFIIFGSFFSVAYIANIVGSAISVSKSKRDYRHQLQHEITSTYIYNIDRYPD